MAIAIAVVVVVVVTAAANTAEVHQKVIAIGFAAACAR
jgi:hypothetical protein